MGYSAEALKVLRVLQKPNARLKFKHICRLTKLQPHLVERSIAELRENHKNLVFAKFDRTF